MSNSSAIPYIASSPISGLVHPAEISGSVIDEAPTIQNQICTLEEKVAAQFKLGTMYLQGRGVTQDYAEAARLYKLAAAQGYAFAQYNLGTMYLDGRGMAQDYAEATRLYKLAAAQGYADAQCILGKMYEDGRGVLVGND